MIDSACYRLMSWLSPSYPVGSFCYSHGLEWVVEEGTVSDAGSLRGWLEDVLRYGSGRCDGILLAETWRAVSEGDSGRLEEVAELAAAFSPSRERHLESTAQGGAFLATTRAAWPSPMLEDLAPSLQGEVAFPVAVGCVAAAHGIPLETTLIAYLQAFAANLVSAGVRLIPLGQTDGQRVTAALESVVMTTSEEARAASLDQLGSSTVLPDMASMRHETQYTRLFRS